MQSPSNGRQSTARSRSVQPLRRPSKVSETTWFSRTRRRPVAGRPAEPVTRSSLAPPGRHNPPSGPPSSGHIRLDHTLGPVSDPKRRVRERSTHRWASPPGRTLLSGICGFVPFTVAQYPHNRCRSRSWYVDDPIDSRHGHGEMDAHVGLNARGQQTTGSAPEGKAVGHLGALPWESHRGLKPLGLAACQGHCRHTAGRRRRPCSQGPTPLAVPRPPLRRPLPRGAAYADTV